MKKTVFYGIAAIPLVGCSLFQTGVDQSTLAQAQHDDHYCQSHGTHYPQSKYLGCRLQLANERREQQYNQLQILDQGSQPTNNVPAPRRDNYTPLSANHYSCKRTMKNGGSYVLCTEHNGG